MILFHYDQGRYFPVVVCDICEKRIVDAQLGAVVHQQGDLETETDLLPCIHAHKGECHDSAEKKIGGRCVWQELSTHFLYLILNSQLTPEKLAKERDTKDAAGHF